MLARLTLVVPLMLAGAIGCVDRARVNSDCEWGQEELQTLLPGNQEHERHLAVDIELATELAVRYADRLHKERFGFEGKGGYVEGGRARDRCMASLLSELAAKHNLPLDVIDRVRAQGYRPVEWDTMVIVLFAAIYAGVSATVARLLSRRFPADEGWPALGAPMIVSLGMSALGLALFQLWAMLLEIVRVGNDHLSGYRASWNPWTNHLLTLYVGGVVMFLVVASLRSWLGRLRLIARKHAV